MSAHSYPPPDDGAVECPAAMALPAFSEAFAVLAAVSARASLLIASCPALAVLVVQSGPRFPREARQAHGQQLVALPRDELLARLGLPAGPLTWRILRKLPPEHCYAHTARKLHRVLATPRHPWLHILPGLPRLTRDTASLLQLDEALVSPELLRASTESDSDVETVYWLVVSIRTMLVQLGQQGPWPYAGVGVERLKLIEGELWARLHPAPIAFPDPPFAGRPGEVEPIRDLTALAREADELGNHACVALFPEIFFGEAYVYAVFQPQRATLVLRRADAFAEWRVDELRGPRNAAPAPGVTASVQAWIEAERRSVPEN